MRRRYFTDRQGKHVCRVCREKYAQELGLCRRCSRAAGVVEAEYLRRNREQLFWLRRQDAPPVRRSVVIDGVEYDVIWDGSVR